MSSLEENESMDLDIQFGEMEEAAPVVKLRPDRNKHYAVVPVFEPVGEDLPVFVDLDAMRDMESHAISDTRVELGGVLLGGQYEDAQGRAFVVISDSLRAQHYEATKGSFKFTHETWEQISRERDEFPDEIQMVGWYHTHPDWSVFLSSMDMFICDNFFNKQLDVALVIDPCRQDRGFFQWTGNPQDRIRRTQGFYLISSRFRSEELEDFAAFLEGQPAMAIDHRLRGGAGGAAPVVNVASSAGSVWQSVALLGMLTVQFCFLMLIGWKILQPAPAVDPQPDPTLAQISESLTQLSDRSQRTVELAARIDLLDGIVGQWDGSPDGLVKSLDQKNLEVTKLQGDLLAHRALERTLNEDLGRLKSAFALAQERESLLQKDVESLKETVDRMEVRDRRRLELMDEYKKKLSVYADGENPEATLFDFNWAWAGIGVVLGLAMGVGAAVAFGKSREEEQSFGNSHEEIVSEANNE